MDFRETSYAGSDHYQDEVYTGHSRARLSGTTNSTNCTNAILNALPSSVYAMLKPSIKPVILTRDQYLYQEEDALDYIYFPETAVVSELKILEDGRTVEVAVIGKDGAIGLASLLSGSHFAPNCTQVSQVGTAQRVSFEIFEKLVRTNPAVRTSVSHFMESYIKQISQKAVCNMYHSVKERLCTWLLMVQDRSGQKMLNLTHEQIARTLGVYRPSVTGVAQELRASSLIDYSRGGISITDRRRTELAACSCYSEVGRIASAH